MNPEQTQLEGAIAALQGQRATLGDAVVDMATAPLRAKLAALLQPSGLQHRQVTVLFADVVGSTAMAQGLAAEDALGVLDRAMRRMAHIVKAHQGRVLKFTGDGVKAAFGMDGSREDDAARAVRAGLDILAAGREQAEAVQCAHGVADFAVRVGLHTGDVALGAGIEADNTAMGAAVNIAARMEQSAPPGALRISHDTWSQVRGLFDMQAQPPLLAKGVAVPMQTYLVRAALDRSVATVERGVQGLRIAMVGRDAELHRLLAAVALARQSRQLQALTLVGDAGLGKSRLLRELSAQLADCRVLPLRCQPDGLLRPWGLPRSLLAAQFSVADSDSAEVARRKVVEGLSPCFEERGEQQAQLIGQLSGLDFGDSPHVRGHDPRSLRDQAFTALRGYLQTLAADGALPVLLVEDLHWADDGSLDLLQHLMSHATELPLALVMSSRPALLLRRPDWATADTAVQLSPLAAAQSDALAQALLGRINPLPPKLTELIVGRAEGNPYYMEELLRRLVDDGVISVGEPHWTVQADRLDTVQLPSTLVGLLQARLDALPAGVRQAARQASIVGHVFWDDALNALDAQAPQALPALQRAAFVKAHGSSDIEGTPERQFDHHLLHQVTYDTLLKAERRLGHGAAARWLAERTQGRGAEFLAMTGEHAERAGETALAVDCFEQAGKEAYKRFAKQAAKAWTRRAVTLLDDANPMRSFDLLNRLQNLADIEGDRPGQDAVLAEMRALLERHPDDPRKARWLFCRALLADRRSSYVNAQRLARLCFSLAQRCGAAGPAAMAQGELAFIKSQVDGDQTGAIEHLKIGLQWVARMEDDPEAKRATTEAQLMTLLAMASQMLGRMDEARDTLQAVLARGVELGSPRLQLGALSGLAELAGDMGRWDDMAGWAQRVRGVAQSCGAQARLGHALLLLGCAAAGLNELPAALDWIEQALAMFSANGDRRQAAIAVGVLGEVHLARGDAGSALRCFSQARSDNDSLNRLDHAKDAAALAALCKARLGQPHEALLEVNKLLAGLESDAVEGAPPIKLLWACQRVLDAAGDARAAPMLEQLFAHVQARAVDLTDEADRERLIQALPDFRGIAAAHGRRTASIAPG
jgi:class 3 adenylate cyclase/tetratricopeptide (TPR) repeat protein